MGYDTYKSGALTIRPPLTNEQITWFDRANQGNIVEDGFPDGYCGWEVGASYGTNEPTQINHEEHQRGDWMEQLEWLIEHKFKPNGQVVNGDVYWDGEESEDLGVLRVRNNRINAYTVQLNYPGGPDWEEPPPTSVRAMWEQPA